MDWNNDGKQDWQDDAFFHTVIDNGGPEKEQPSFSGGSSSKGRGASAVSTMVPLLYLGLLLPGDIPVNGFTMFVGLLCLGTLIVKILRRIYK